jgi:hypothetical protein
MLLSKDLEDRLPFFLNPFDTELNQCRCGSNLSNIQDLSCDNISAILLTSSKEGDEGRRVSGYL